MRYSYFLNLVLIFICLIGCTTQGRLTYLKFEKSKNYVELNSSMEKLKNQYNSSIQNQLSALREIRYISKHMKEPGKREMALRALTFFTFMTDDGDIQDRSLSRLNNVLDEPEWPKHLKLNIIDSIVDLVTGKLGFQEKHDGMMMVFGVESKVRKDALMYLLNKFEGLEPQLQYHAVGAFHKLLLTVPSLTNCPENICDEDIRKNQEEWDLGVEIKANIPANADPKAVEAGAYGPLTKREPLEEREEWNEEMDELKLVLWEWIEDALDDQDVPYLIQGRLIRFAGEIELFPLQEGKSNEFIEQVSEWAENEDISVDLRKLLGASREKVKIYGYPSTKSPQLSDKAYKGIKNRPIDFLETHINAILHQQLERQKSGFDPGEPDALTLAFSSFNETDEGDLRREIVLENVTTALQKGLLGDISYIAERTLKSIDDTRSDIDLEPLLNLVGALYPSLKAQKRSPKPLFETLLEKAEAAEKLYERRLYLNAILEGAAVFPVETNLILASASDQDVVTSHQINSVIQTLDESF